MKHLWAVILFAGAVPARAGERNPPKSLAAEEGGPPAFAAEEVGERTVGACGSLQPTFSLAPAVGELHARGADRAARLGGAQARLHFLQFRAAEGSIPFHENRYECGDARVTQDPVQVSSPIYPLPNARFSPNLVGSGGWTYSRITDEGDLSGLSNETEHTFGVHAGAGLEFRLVPSTSVHADLRYIFLHPRGSAIRSEDFNGGQVVAGHHLFF